MEMSADELSPQEALNEITNLAKQIQAIKPYQWDDVENALKLAQVKAERIEELARELARK